MESYSNTVLSADDFRRLSALIEGQYGIKMPPEKKVMLEARLHKRLKALQYDNFRDYCDYLFSGKGTESEIPAMIDLVSTNKTDFFREPDHFKILTSAVIPKLLENWPIQSIKIWSAGCSTGEEPYTLAMTCQDYFEKLENKRKDPEFLILATDISTRVLATAENAVYYEEDVLPIPDHFRRKYLLRSKDRDSGLFRISPAIRKKVWFHRLNLMDETFPISDRFHVIFCRNVMIYFSREIQRTLILKLAKFLLPGGYFFTGHSETLINMDLPLRQIAPGLYFKGEEYDK